MNVEVFKFGGASVNSAEGVRNVVEVLKLFPGKSMMLVLSAMGKTTNALERILHHYMERDAVSMVEEYHQVKDFHLDVVNDLFEDKTASVFEEVENQFEALRRILQQDRATDYDETYDRVVSFGETFSTTILFHYLASKGIDIRMFDATSIIHTDSSFRDARIDWRKTQLTIQKQLFTYFQDNKGSVGLTQGFIGNSPEGKPTTLGREGSDFTAAVIGYCMRVKKVTVWKDVPGVLNADPVWFNDPKKLDDLSFLEAIELAYYGAKIFHPKTIKPLENANITLHVRSFQHPEEEGTLVRHMQEWKISTPIFIRKQDQLLISISPKDFSFIVEENLSHIFTLLAQFHVKANVTQNSAISFSICVDDDPIKIKPLIRELQKSFEVRYNDGLELFTIRHYNEKAIKRITSDRTILLEQKSRTTIHFVLQ